jgi:hypothetical protein
MEQQLMVSLTVSYSIRLQIQLNGIACYRINVKCAELKIVIDESN